MHPFIWIAEYISSAVWIVSLRSFIFKRIWQNYYVSSNSQGEILILTMIRNLGNATEAYPFSKVPTRSSRWPRASSDLLSEVKESKWAILRVKRPQKKTAFERAEDDGWHMSLTTKKTEKKTNY